MKVLTAVTASAIVGAGAVFYVVAFHPVLRQRAELAGRLDELQRTNDVLRAQIAELQRRQSDFKTDPSYVELEARRMGLSRDNEKVFDFSVEHR